MDNANLNIIKDTFLGPKSSPSLLYSGTSDKGHSERGQTSQQIKDKPKVQWNLLMRTLLGLAILSFVEVNCPLSEVIFYRVCIQEYFLLVLCWEAPWSQGCPLSEVSLYSCIHTL